MKIMKTKKLKYFLTVLGVSALSSQALAFESIFDSKDSYGHEATKIHQKMLEMKDSRTTMKTQKQQLKNDIQVRPPSVVTEASGELASHASSSRLISSDVSTGQSSWQKAGSGVKGSYCRTVNALGRSSDGNILTCKNDHKWSSASSKDKPVNYFDAFKGRTISCRYMDRTGEPIFWVYNYGWVDNNGKPKVRIGFRRAPGKTCNSSSCSMRVTYHQDGNSDFYGDVGVNLYATSNSGGIVGRNGGGNYCSAKWK